MQTKIITVFFGLIFKRKVDLSLFLSDWYFRKFRLTDLPGHDGKLTPDKKMIGNSTQSCKGESRFYCSHFLVIFERTSKFVIVFVKLIMGKVRVEVFTGYLREIDIRYEFSLKKVIKGWKWN